MTRGAIIICRTSAAFLLLAVSSYAAELRIESGTAAGNEPVTVKVQLTCLGELLSGVQFDLEYDTTALEVAVTAGPAAENAGKVVQTAPVPGKQRVLLIGFNRNTLADGAIAILVVSVKTRPAAAKTYRIHLAALSGTNSQGQAIGVTGQDAILTVLSGGRNENSSGR